MLKISILPMNFKIIIVDSQDFLLSPFCFSNSAKLVEKLEKTNKQTNEKKKEKSFLVTRFKSIFYSTSFFPPPSFFFLSEP